MNVDKEKNIEEPMYINPLTDYGFKKIFGDKEIMIAFLTDLIQPKSPIEDVIFLDKEMSPENELLRGVIYDLRCKTKNGEEFIVEMQNRMQENFADRIIYYLSRSISSQAKKGKDIWDYKLKPVYGIFFLNFHLHGFEPMPIRTIKTVIEETNQQFSNKVKAYILELPDYKNKGEEYAKDKIEYWLYNLVNMETMNRPLPFQAQQPIFSKMADISRFIHLSEEERRKYNISVDTIRTHLCVMKNERKEGIEEGLEEGMKIGEMRGIEKGKKEGMKIGEKRGIERGKKEGIKEGMKEGEKKKSLLIAQNMKKKGLPIDVIIECTNLSKEDIEKLD